MHRVRLFQVDAFTTQLFTGNPAAVCPLEAWPADPLLQAIASENNLSETAFFVAPPGASQGRYVLRWFTPAAEVDLCGHATLAAAFVVFTELAPGLKQVFFDTRSGTLSVHREGDRLIMDFPSRPPLQCAPPAALIEALGREPEAVLRADDYLAVFPDARTVAALAPDLAKLANLDLRGVCISAPDLQADFVSRFFAPKYGVPEDPVTGSTHCMLAPYWSERLGKTTLTGRQLSRRGGEIQCTLRGERVVLAGHAVKYLDGWIDLPNEEGAAE